MGAEIVTPPAESPRSELDKVISESRIQLEGRKQAAVKKRGRGRPKGSIKKATELGETTSLTETSSADVGAELPDLTPFIRQGVALPFAVLAENTGFEQFKLAEDEADGLAPQIQSVLRQYAPNVMHSPHAPAYMLAGSVVMLAASKYAAYRLHLKAQAALEASRKTETGETSFTPAVQASEAGKLYPLEKF